MKKIVIVRGNEFKVYEGEIAPGEDIFEEIYQKAGEQKAYLEQYAKRMQEEAQKEQGGPSEYLNNIIAFCGERGQGKSTAMLHFVRELRQEDDKEVLRVIDPTSMEMAHDIVDIIISQLFAQFRKNREKNESRDISLTQAFQKVHRNMSVLKNAQNFIEREYAYNGSLQNLSDITDSMEMRADIMDLVGQYLDWKEKKMLVIPIDDLDLNLDHVYKVAEQLRKYFMVPQIMIVMAVNIDQLTLCVERELLKNLEPLNASDRWNMRQEARNMSNRYMEKLIPFSRRMWLPDIHAIAADGKDAVEIIYQDEPDKEPYTESEIAELVELASGISIPAGQAEQAHIIFDSEQRGIEKGILNLIYEKTGLVYVPKPNEIHPIVPFTLRELVNLISVLGDMGADQAENLEMFEQYFCHVWLENNLSDQSAALVREIAGTQTKDLHNDAFLLLYEMQEIKIREAPKSIGSNIIDPLTRNVNGVYEAMQYGVAVPDNGDLINCLRLLRQGEKSDRSRLVMAVMTIFSVRMLKLKAAKQWEVLYDFVGENLFGSFRLIRQKALGGGQVTPRVKFEYRVKPFMEDMTGQALPSSVADIRKVVDSEKLALTLVLMGISSEFKNADGTPRKLISNNHLMAEKAVFDLNLLFRSGISRERIKEKISLEKWEIEEQLFDAAYEEMYQEDAWKELACNMEELFCLARYAQEHYEINDTANEADHYTYFFQNVKRFLKSLEQSHDLLGTLEETDAEEWGERIARMKPADVKKPGQEEYVTIELETAPSETVIEKKSELPSCRKDTKWEKMVKNLEQMKQMLEECQDKMPKMTYDLLFQDWEYLYKLSVISDGRKEVGREVTDKYNEIRRKIIQ